LHDFHECGSAPRQTLLPLTPTIVTFVMSFRRVDFMSRHTRFANA